MKQLLYLFIYVVIAGLICKVIADSTDYKALMLVFLPVAFVGWFILLGMVFVEGDKYKSGIDISLSGVKSGFNLFKDWGKYMLVMLAISIIGGILLLLLGVRL